MKKMLLIFIVLLVLILSSCVNPTKNVYGLREATIIDKHSYYEGNYETTSYKIFVEFDWYDENNGNIQTHSLIVDKEIYDSLDLGNIVIVDFYTKLSLKGGPYGEFYHVEFIRVKE